MRLYVVSERLLRERNGFGIAQLSYCPGRASEGIARATPLEAGPKGHIVQRNAG